MMKFKTVYVFFTLLSFFSSCMREDMDGCDDDGPNVHFPLLYDRDLEGANFIEDHIDFIDLILFNDVSQRPAYHIEFRLSDLDEDKTIKLKLPHGEYYAVSIGNLFNDRHNIYQDATLNEGIAIRHNQTESVDELYYAPDLRNYTRTRSSDQIPSCYGFSVEEGKITVHPIEYMGAHHVVNFWLKDFPEVTNQLELPFIRMDNFSSTYGFRLQRNNERKHFLQQAHTAVNPEGDLMGYKRFYVPHFHNEDNITINITGNNGSQDYSFEITMEEVLRVLGENHPEDGHRAIIDCVLEYRGTTVNVVIPSWGSHDVGGGLGKE